jgi:hypothetical protein
MSKIWLQILYCQVLTTNSGVYSFLKSLLTHKKPRAFDMARVIGKLTVELRFKLKTMGEST